MTDSSFSAEQFADNIVKASCAVLYITKTKKKHLRKDIISSVMTELQESVVPSPFHCVITSLIDQGFDDDAIDEVVTCINEICKNFVIDNINDTLFEIVNVCDEFGDGSYSAEDISEKISIDKIREYSPETIGLYCVDQLRPIIKTLKNFDMDQFVELVQTDLVNSLRCEVNEAPESEEEISEQELEEILQAIDSNCSEYECVTDEEEEDDDDYAEEYEEEIDDLYEQIELKDKELEIKNKQLELKDQHVELLNLQVELLNRELDTAKQDVQTMRDEVDIFKMVRTDNDSPGLFLGLLGLSASLLFLVFSNIDHLNLPKGIEFTSN